MGGILRRMVLPGALKASMARTLAGQKRFAWRSVADGFMWGFR
jgi:hypothetical protein